MRGSKSNAECGESVIIGVSSRGRISGRGRVRVRGIGRGARSAIERAEMLDDHRRLVGEICEVDVMEPPREDSGCQFREVDLSTLTDGNFMYNLWNSVALSKLIYKYV